MVSLLDQAIEIVGILRAMRAHITHLDTTVWRAHGCVRPATRPITPRQGLWAIGGLGIVCTSHANRGELATTGGAVEKIQFVVISRARRRQNELFCCFPAESPRFSRQFRAKLPRVLKNRANSAHFSGVALAQRENRRDFGGNRWLRAGRSAFLAV